MHWPNCTEDQKCDRPQWRIDSLSTVRSRTQVPLSTVRGLFSIQRCGRDIYAVTAPIVVEATGRAIKGLVRATGVRSAGEAFDAREFLESLSPAHFSIEFQVGGMTRECFCEQTDPRCC